MIINNRGIPQSFPEHRLEKKIHIQTQIGLNTIFVLETKRLLIIYTNNF